MPANTLQQPAARLPLPLPFERLQDYAMRVFPEWKDLVEVTPVIAEVGHLIGLALLVSAFGAEGMMKQGLRALNALEAERGLAAPEGWEWEHDLGWSKAYPALGIRVYVQLVTPENVADGWRWEADPIGGDVQEPLFESDAEADGGCALALIEDAERAIALRLAKAQP